MRKAQKSIFIDGVKSIGCEKTLDTRAWKEVIYLTIYILIR